MISEELFKKRITLREQELAAAKKQDAAYSVTRLIVGVAFILSFYGYFTTDYQWLAVVFFLLVAVFIFLLKKHRKLRSHLQYLKNWIEVNEDEIRFIQKDYTAFPSGESFRDPKHPFTGDLDVFGKESLFQRVARTATNDGTALLARWFNKVNATEHIEDKQAAVRELSTKLDWRQEFLTAGKKLEESSSVRARIGLWMQSTINQSWMLTPVVAWSFSLLFSLAAIAIYLSGEFTYFKYLGGVFLLNLFFFSRILKDFKAEREHVDDLSKTFNSYAKFIQLIESEKFESPKLQALQQALKTDTVSAGDALKKYAKILDQLDSLDNALGAAIINGLVQYHLHVFKQMLAWKSTYAKQMLLWLDVIAEMDAWVSLGNYAHLNNDFNYPEIDDHAEFEATKLGHPFLDADVRVCNDLKFDGFKLVILTGSNMAGKSTFLRSIGVNLIFTALGLPVCAESLKTRKYQLLSSMKPQDSLTSNESYFQAEVNRLRMLVDMLDADRKSFILLDEILRGTNSQDKRNGTKAFLEKIKTKNLTGIIATHDVEITELTAQQREVYSNRFFESQLKNNELVFDYQLRNGVCETPNATDLMRIKGII